MHWSQIHIPTLREVPTEAEIASHRLMLRAGLIRKLSAGVYSYLPLGQRSLLKVIGIVREEMNAAGAQEVLLPALQPAEIWKRSGRYEGMGPEMIRFKDRHGKEMVLGPTHEEVITLLVAGELRSYRDLPKNLYQIQTKFRDEPRPRFGVIRSSEFIMKDAYSFDRDAAGLKKSYQGMYEAYQRIFSRCALEAIPVEAESGIMGGEDSHEFMVPAKSGEDIVVRCPACSWAASKDRAEKQVKGSTCPKCKGKVETLNAIEVGHVFQLGSKYSAALGATYLDEDGKEKPFEMGCYGVGVTRILAAVIETHHDEAGIQWPVAIAPFPVVIVPINMGHGPTQQACEEIHKELAAAGISTLLDDREVSGGVKLKDADLIGFPIRILLSEKTLQGSAVEFKLRTQPQPTLLKRSELIPTLKKHLDRGTYSVG